MTKRLALTALVWGVMYGFTIVDAMQKTHDMSLKHNKTSCKVYEIRGYVPNCLDEKRFRVIHSKTSNTAGGFLILERWGKDNCKWTMEYREEGQGSTEFTLNGKKVELDFYMNPDEILRRLARSGKVTVKEGSTENILKI